MDISKVKFDSNGLVPVVVQDVRTGQVLMFAYANKEALEKTVETGKTHFWSRSRKKLWQKGEESGNVQEVEEIFIDCDNDCILALVKQTGVACHTGAATCFYRNSDGEAKTAYAFENASQGKSLDDVYRVIDDRKRNPKEGSYVSGLFEKGIDRILKKISEEAGETIIAAKNEDKSEIVYEAADLIFHTLIALANFDLTPSDIYRELERRFGKPSEAYRNTDRKSD